jgi:Zn-dependent membrane protease YugP
VGHALQDRQRDPWMAVRQTIVPAVQFGSGIAPWLILGGLFTNMLGLAWLGLIGVATPSVHLAHRSPRSCCVIAVQRGTSRA